MNDPLMTPVLCAADRGDWPAAWTLLEEALSHSGPQYDLLVTAGMLLARLDRFHEARSHLLRAVASDDQRPEAHLGLADLFVAQGEPRRAAAYLHQACEAQPDSPLPHNRLTEVYGDLGLPYAAKQAARASLACQPRQPDVRATLGSLEQTFPDRDVTVYVPCYNAGATIERVLDAVFAQSIALAEVLVIDDGSTDDSIARAARYPVRIITHGNNRGLSAARNTALLASKTTYLAHVDSDVIPDQHWLERCLLHFESERLNQAAGSETGAPLGGVMGRLDELNDVDLADQWRVVHMGQHHGDAALDEVPHLYGCNSVWLREALYRAGGHDERYRTNGEDCDASERVRGLGYRLAYDPAARCVHLRRDNLTSVLRTIWRYHTPYYEYRYGLFGTGELADVLKKLPENLQRHQDDWNLDTSRRTWHLMYPTFLGLPWRLLSDLKLAAASCPAEKAPRIRETHAAVFLGLFEVLGAIGAKEDLVRLIHEDLAPCLPEDEALAEFCGIESALAAFSGAGNPADALMGLCETSVATLKGAVTTVWASLNETTWSIVRASAFRLRDEAANRAKVAPNALRVAIVNAPWGTDGRLGVRAGSRWPFTQDSRGERVPCYVPFPFYLSTAAAMLRETGCEVLLIDAIAEGLYTEEFLRRLEGFDPQVVLMETATASHEIDQDWALRLKETLGQQTLVLMCGPHATAIGEELMAEAPQVDAILIGEYEPTLVELMSALQDGSPLTEIKGLIWREEDGTVHAQTERRELPPMEAFPWPDRSTLPMYNYFDSFAGAMPWPNVQMHASRGCPYKCIFCVWPQVVYASHSYRTRENAEIVAEMAWLLERYGFQAIYFDDDTFNIQNDRIIDLCDRIADQHLGVPITAMGRADTSNREAFEAMKRAGLVGIKFGVETGDPEMMKRIKKHLDLDRVRQTVGWCKELGLGVHLTFSFGGPEETHETAQKTIDLALELDPDTVQFSLMTPFPGTSMYADAIQNGTLLTRDWTKFDGARYTVVKGEYLSRDELEGLILEAHWRWLLHLAARDAKGRLGRCAERRVTVGADELSDLADGSVDLLVLSTPLQDCAQHLSTLSACRAKLTPGGTLIAGRGGPEVLPSNWSDEPLLRELDLLGFGQLAAHSGFNGEVAMVLSTRLAPAALSQPVLAWSV